MLVLQICEFACGLLLFFYHKPLNLVSRLVFFVCVLFSRVFVCVCVRACVRVSSHKLRFPPLSFPLWSLWEILSVLLLSWWERERMDRCSKTPLHFLPSPLPSISPSHYSCLLFILLHQTHTLHCFLWVLFPLPLFFLYFSFAQSHKEKMHYEYLNLQKCHWKRTDGEKYRV